MPQFKVLIPLDETAFSRNVLPHVQRFLRPEEYELILFHVVPVAESILAGSSQFASAHATAHAATYPMAEGGERDTAQATLPSILQDEVQMLQEAGYMVSVVEQSGYPTDQIVEFVDHHGIDMVAMATHGRTGLKRLIMGSVAEDVLHHLSVPALLVHSIEEE